MDNQQTVPSEPMAAVSQPEANPPKQKLKFSELLNEAWELTGKKFWCLFGIYLMTTIVMMLIAFCYILVSAIVLGITYYFQSPTVFAFLGILLVLGLIALMVWLSVWQVAASYAYLESDDNHTVLALLNGTYAKAKTIVPTVLLAMLVVLAGYVVFIVPGIIMSVSLAFITVVAVLEDRRMWDALTRSRNLVRGHWWNVLVQMIGIGLLSFVALIATGGQYSPLSILLTPFIFVYTFLVYKKLVSFQEQKVPTARGNWYYKAAAVLGIVLIAGGTILGSMAIGKNWEKIKASFSQDAKSQEDAFFDELEYEDGAYYDESIVE